MSMSTGNPALARDPFAAYAMTGRGTATMTISGTVGKTALLLAILTATAGWTWTQTGNGTLNPALLFGSLIGALIVGFITIFKPTVAPFTSPVYAALEGVLLGAISNMLEQRYKGIAVQATSLTFATLGIMLFLYGTRIIRVTQRLAMGITAATGAVFLVYMVAFVLRLFHVPVSFLDSASPLSIGISLVIVGIAAFNLLLDFDYIERGSRGEVPKVMEWYAAFSLLVTLVWLYLEILRLLSKMRDR
ncbi:MAG TPA: Bax inhibitor-1/YccA family protein [Isosphaeraceae bacterium]|jgi:uncharacterized YccA/Bax inhibitor family protein|nr:Bax inhibitor-1/YccA family protein [Isosphaeraceae bacterium]